MNEPKQVTPSYSVQTLSQVIAEHVTLALTIYAWNMSKTAEAIGVDRRTLYRLVERHKIVRPTELPADDDIQRCIGCGKPAPASSVPPEPGLVWACSPACSRKQAEVIP